MERIFISIAAYNEPDLELTIKSALENALHPERIYFGITTHYTDGAKPNLSKYENVRTVNFEYNSQFLTPLNRLISISLMKDEDYFLQIDAHMLFEPEWDQYLIDIHKEIVSEHGKSVISNYLPPWCWSDFDEIVKIGGLLGGRMVLNKDIYMHTDQRHPVSSTEEYTELDHEKYVEHFLMSGHFIFANSKYILDVSPDPFIAFAGEEETLAMRTYTRGYKIFGLRKNVIWHKTKEQGKKYKFDWRIDERFRNRQSKEMDVYWYKTEESMVRIAEILQGDWFGYYGAKDLDSYNDYCQKLGQDYKQLYRDMIAEAETDIIKYEPMIATNKLYLQRKNNNEKIH